MKIIFTTLVMLMALFTNNYAASRPSAINTTDSTTYKLTIVVSNVNNRTGKLYVGLSNNASTFSGESLKTTSVDVPSSGEITLSFEGLAPGRYAVRLYQDINGNQKMDFSGGLPAEPFGFSTIKMLMGPPDFDQCAFDLNENKSISIRVMEM